jgi:predicted PhzF superfamily epimerase YddE/YHI9
MTIFLLARAVLNIDQLSIFRPETRANFAAHCTVSTSFTARHEFGKRQSWQLAKSGWRIAFG